MKPSDNVLSLYPGEIADRVAKLGERPYRARQVCSWIYGRNATGYDRMTSLPAGLREKLAHELPFPVFNPAKREDSSDGTVKFAWELCDKERIEAVFIPMREHDTLCVSSQAGCRFRCAFCASGQGGLKRNLDCGEIVAQLLHARSEIGRPATHVVFMGVGEPLDNYDNVIKAARIFNSEEAFNIAARRITISTCGIVPGIRRLKKEGMQFELSVSLHAPNDEIRNRIMPVNRKYPVSQLMAACREYAEATGRQVTFEYVLIDGLTDTDAAAGRLIAMLSGWLCKVNLIALNPVKESGFKPASRDGAEAFGRRLKAGGVHSTLRSPRGRDISAACGQLRRA